MKRLLVVVTALPLLIACPPSADGDADAGSDAGSLEDSGVIDEDVDAGAPAPDAGSATEDAGSSTLSVAARELVRVTPTGGGLAKGLARVAVPLSSGVGIAVSVASSSFDYAANGQPPQAFLLPAGNTGGVVIARVDDDGIAAWTRVIAGAGDINVAGGVLDDESLLFVGCTDGDTLVSQGEIDERACPGTQQNLMAARYTLDGELAWSFCVDAVATGCFQSVAVLDGGGFAAAGSLVNDVDLDALSGPIPLRVASAGTGDHVVVVFDAAGEVLWATSFGSAGFDGVNALVHDAQTITVVAAASAPITVSGTDTTVELLGEGTVSFAASFDAATGALTGATVLAGPLESPFIAATATSQGRFAIAGIAGPGFAFVDGPADAIDGGRSFVVEADASGAIFGVPLIFAEGLVAKSLAFDDGELRAFGLAPGGMFVATSDADPIVVESAAVFFFSSASAQAGRIYLPLSIPTGASLPLAGNSAGSDSAFDGVIGVYELSLVPD